MPTAATIRFTGQVTASLLAVPLLDGTTVRGVIVARDKRAGGVFGPADERALEVVARSCIAAARRT